MKIIYVSLIAILFAVSVFSQQSGNVTGRIVDSGAGGIVADVVLRSIHDPNIVYRSRSNENGTFSIINVRPGNYLLKATVQELTERLTGEMRVYVGDAGGTTVELTIGSGVIRESVTVSAGLLQPGDEIAKSVNVIVSQEMRERADITLVDSLRTVPGLRIQQLGGFGRTANIKSRGLRNQDTAILIDGFRIRDTSSITGDASAFLSDLTLTSVERVEVLRGPGSSIYGTNAIGGTVNFITPEPRSKPSGQISYAVGGLGLHRVRGNFSDATASERFGFNLAGSRTVYTKGIDGNDDARNTNLQGKIVVKASTGTNFSARVFFSDAYVRLNTDPDTLGPLPASNATIINAQQGVNFRSDADDPDREQRSRSLNGQFSFAHSFRSDVVFNASYSGLTTRRRNENGPLGRGFQSASTSVFEGSTNTANASVLWSPESFQIRLGYEFEREGYRNLGETPSGTGNFFTDAGQSSHTIFAQTIFSARDDRLQLAGGVRGQIFRLQAPSFSLNTAPYTGFAPSEIPSALIFDGAVSYFFRSSGTKIRSHIGNGYRVPSMYERYGTFYSTFPSGNFVALGDPGLKPEKTVGFDAGIDQLLAQDRVKLSAAYFYNSLTDTIGYGNIVPAIGTTPRPFGGYINQKGGISRGGEFSGTVRPIGSLDIFASYTFTSSRQREPQVTGSGLLTTLGIPRGQFTLVATKRFGRAWASFDLLATSSYFAPIFSNSTFSTYVYRFNGNRRGDLTGGYTFSLDNGSKSLRVFGTIENLFASEYYENGFRTAGVSGRLGIAFGF